MIKYRRLTMEEQSKAIARANHIAIRRGKKKAPDYVIKAIMTEKVLMTTKEIQKRRNFYQAIRKLMEDHNEKVRNEKQQQS